MYKVKRYMGEIKYFATLADAVRHIGSAVLSFKGSFYRKPTSWGGRDYCLNDSHIVHDDLGLVVPVTVLKRAYENLPPYRWNHRKRLAKPEHFRRMPVPYTSSAGNYGSYYREPRTMMERRENAYLEVDSETLDFNIRPRRRGRELPTSWDDICRKREKNWKRQRRTRWR